MGYQRLRPAQGPLALDRLHLQEGDNRQMVCQITQPARLRPDIIKERAMKKTEAIKKANAMDKELPELIEKGLMENNPNIRAKVGRVKSGGWDARYIIPKAVTDFDIAVIECGGKDRCFMEAAYFGDEE